MTLRRKLASQSAVILAARVFGSGAIFVLQALMARMWGSDLLGEYLLLIAAINLIAMVMPLGFATVGTYFTSRYIAQGQGRQLRAFMVRAYAHIGLVCATLLVLGYPATRFLGEAGAVLAQVFVPSIILAAALAVVFLNGAVLVGLRRPIAGYMADAVFRPLAIIAAFALASVFSMPAERIGSMFWMLAAIYGLVALIHFAFVVGPVRTLPEGTGPIAGEARQWWRYAVPWVLISIATDFFFDIDLLLLAGMLDRHTLAVFGVCAKIFSLVSFGVSAVYAVTMPDMFASAAKSDTDGLHARVGDANLVATGLAVVLFSGAALGAPLVLRLFGPGFEAGAAPLAILCLGLVVRGIFGPASLVLSMRDKPAASLPAVFGGVASLIVFNLLLVPRFGLMGAAVAALSAMTLWSAALWFTALRGTRVDVSIFPRLRRAA